MALDLSVLEEKTFESTGRPLDLLLIDIEEDLQQPRTVFSEHALQEMTESIRQRGVKTPISVRPHPSKPGKWLLNHGARRYRGSQAAGCRTIPAFIDENHNDYDQVIENLHRENLKPMEIALFINKRLKLGDSKQQIAQLLAKDTATITHHLALIDLPLCLEKVYSTERCQSPKTLYELRSLHKSYPQAVEDWCQQDNDITRQTVNQLAKSLREQITQVTLEKQVVTSSSKPHRISKHNDKSSFGHDQMRGIRLLDQPRLWIRYQDRLAILLLKYHPSKSGFIYIQFSDDDSIREVETRYCVIQELNNCYNLIK